MKSLRFILILLLSIGLKSVYSQPITHFECEVFIDSSQTEGSSRSVTDSENGWYLPASGTIKILIVFAEANYTLSSNDPDLTGSPGWPVNDVPIWANQLVDKTVLQNPQGVLTRYFKEASSGNLNVIGDYLQAPYNNGVFTVSSADSLVSNGSLVAEINAAMNGDFLTNGGVSTPQTFDNWTKATSAGKPKITPSTDFPLSYDHVMVIWRNHNKYNGGNGYMSRSYGQIVGYNSDTFTQFGSSGGRIPTLIARHEFAHCILGSNNFHSAGGGAQTNYWITHAGGYGLLGGAGSSLLTWNGWDRHRLGWKNPAHSHLISARNTSGIEVNGDLDATISAHAGIYVLRDFVATGDAIRIKLPFLNPTSEFQQYLWFENHQGLVNNNNEFDQFVYQSSSPCIEPMQRGLTIALQIDKDTKTGSSTFSGYMDYVRQLSADGMWERSFDPPTPDACLLGWNQTPRPATKIRENPLTGRSDLDRASIKFNPDSIILKRADQEGVSAEKVNGVFEYKLFYNGNPRQLFTAAGNNKIAIGTNPTSAGRMNQAGKDAPLYEDKDVRSIYLNGVKVEILDMLSNGDIKIKVDFDHIEIEDDVTWMAPDIVLNEIPSPSGYSLILKSGNTLTLDHGMAATRMTDLEIFEGDEVFTSPTAMHVKENAAINLETGSEFIIDRKSKLSLEENSRIDIQNGAVLRIKHDGILDIQKDAVVNIMDGGKLIIEKAGVDYGSGELHFAQNARINLNGSNALIDVNGLIEIGDDAVFKLSDQTNALKTSGKIKFHGGYDNSVEIIAGNNASVHFQGYSKTQEVLINLNTSLEFPDNLDDFKITNLRVSQGYACRITPPYSNTCNIVFQNVYITNITGGFNNYGLKLFGQAKVKIDKCTFYNCWFGISSLSFELGNSLSVTNSDFEHCQTGIFTNGKGANLRNVNFKNCADGWNAWSTSSASNVSKCKGTNTYFTNINYEGATPLLVSESQFYDAQKGISMIQATVKVECTYIQNHSQYGLDVGQNAALLLGKPYGNNRLNNNTRTIHLNKAHTIELSSGRNNLTPSTSGTKNAINGSLICSGPTTIPAYQTKWNASNNPPNSTDYNVYRLCIPSSPVTFSPTSPLSYMLECYATIDPIIVVPGGRQPNDNTLGSLQGSDSNEINESNNLSDESIGDELLAIESKSLIQALRRGSIFDFINNSETEDALEQMPINEFIANKISSYYELKDLITAPSATENIGNSIFTTGITELFSTFVEFNSLPDSLMILSPILLDDLFISTLTILDKAISSFPDSPDYLFGLHLSKAQAYRIYGNYVSAISEIAIAQTFASDESQNLLAENLNCMFSAESIMVANPGKDEWPAEFSACDYSIIQSDYAAYNPFPTDNEKPINTESVLENVMAITAHPNPTTNSVLITPIDAESEIKSIDVFDTLGKKVISTNSIENKTIKLSGLPNGIYFVQVTFGDGNIGTTKILKSE